MNSQREAEEFIKKINETSRKSNLPEILFSLYKSRVERIKYNTNIRRYNDFGNNSVSGVGSSVHRSYNSNLLFLFL